MDKNTKSATKKSKISIGHLSFEKETITNTGGDEVYILNGHEKTIHVSIKLNDDRMKFLVNVAHDGRKTSLSFFERKNLATNAVNTYIVSLFGKVRQVGS